MDAPKAALDPIAQAEMYSKFCEEIAVFQDGSVIQHGSHEALLSDKCGKYRKLWNAQAQYYTEKKT